MRFFGPNKESLGTFLQTRHLMLSRSSSASSPAIRRGPAYPTPTDELEPNDARQIEVSALGIASIAQDLS